MVTTNERRLLTKPEDPPRFVRALYATLKSRYQGGYFSVVDGVLVYSGGKAAGRRILYFVVGYRNGWEDNDKTDA